MIQNNRYINQILYFLRVRFYLLLRGLNIIRKEGFRSFQQRVDNMQSNNYISHQVIFRGLPKSYLAKLLRIYIALERMRKYCFDSRFIRYFCRLMANHSNNEYVEAVSRYQFRLRLSNKRTALSILNFVRSSCVISGWFFDAKSVSASQIRFVFKGEAYYPARGPSTDVLDELPETIDCSINRFGLYNIFSVPLGLHRLRLEVKDRDFSWVAVRRVFFVRLTNNKLSPEIDFSYADWVKQEQAYLQQEKNEIAQHINVMIKKPTFLIILNGMHDSRNENAVIESINKQIYPYWKIIWRGGQSTSSKSSGFDYVHGNSILDDSDIRYDFVIVLESGQCLAENALYEFASAINMFPMVDVVYGDEDCIDAYGNRHGPFFKPNWSAEYLEALNYIGFPTCFRANIAKKLIRIACLKNYYDFVLRYTELTENVFHINKILGHARDNKSFSRKEKAKYVQNDIEALSGRLSRTGRSGSVTQYESHERCYTLRIDLKKLPVISIIINIINEEDACDKLNTDLIKNAIDQIYKCSTYEQLEVIIAYSGDLSQEQICYIRDTGCKKINSCDSTLDCAAIFNKGVTLAKGDLLIFMNHNFSVLEPSWIEYLVQHFEKPQVGAVGYKLTCPENKIDHRGFDHTMGVPQSLKRWFRVNEAGYFYSACGVRNDLPINGEYFATPANIFRRVGGFTTGLKCNYIISDYYQKMKMHGLVTLYEPNAELILIDNKRKIFQIDVENLDIYRLGWKASPNGEPFNNDWRLP